MMTEQESSISELKSHVYGLANSKQADQYTKMMKVIAEYVGQVYGPEMKVLVSLGQEMEPEEPDYPSDDKVRKQKQSEEGLSEHVPRRCTSMGQV